MRLTVYIETTIPSYYCAERTELAGDIKRTRQWWDHEREAYECFISPVVIDELSGGDYPRQQACLALLQGLASLEVTPEVVGIAEAYQAQMLMPQDPPADAVHLALASYYRIDHLLTWNCRHLANVNKERHMEALNVRMGLGTPRLITPHLLLPLEDSSL